MARTHVSLLALLCAAAMVALASAQAPFTCPPTYTPADSCTAGPCRCALFQTMRIQTNPNTSLTEVIIRVTNKCQQPVYYVQFSMDDPSKKFSLQLNQPAIGSKYISGSGSYGWTVSLVDGRALATATQPAITWLRFTATPSPNTNMQAGTTQKDYEDFRFVVKNYSPIFPWFYQLHQGPDWDTFGPLDMSLCKCSNCDAGSSVRTIQSCRLRYVDDSTNLSPSVFNEDEILYSFQIEGNKLELFYSDEHAMTLGINKVVSGGVTTLYNTTATTSTPTCVSGSQLKLGLWNFDGRNDQANIDGNSGATGCKELTTGTMTCGRPMPPALFVTDLFFDNNSRAGDWQQGGKPYPPQKICGLWKSATKTVASKNSFGTYVFDISAPGNPNPNRNSAGTGWNLGAGADPLPIGFINPANTRPSINAYGTEVMWDLNLLKLEPTHRYRFQFTVHDGDQTKVGGDVGQACIEASPACPDGFTGNFCTQCDSKPLPGDGSYTWYCFPTGANTTDNAYQLLKVPTVKLRSDPLYINSGGFIPDLTKPDPEGYFVTCDCKRIKIPCPENCCGNGVCNDAKGLCTCARPELAPDLATCCPTVNITDVCFNDGNYCSGHGICLSGQCQCTLGADGTPDFAGVACNETVTKRKRCRDLNATDCTSCLAAATASGVYCGWCTLGAPGSAAALATGSCQEDTSCTNPGATNLAACLITTTYVPEPCPDNCTGHGMCVNSTLPIPPNAKNGTVPNVTRTCQCDEGYSGANCGALNTVVTVAAITAGAIAGIVIAVVAFFAIAGGGAYAAAQAMGSGGVTAVVNNPLYKADGNAGTNPLYKA